MPNGNCIPSHLIYLRVLVIAGKPVPVPFEESDNPQLEENIRDVLNFKIILYFVFLFRKIITVHKTRFVNQNIIRKDCTK